MADTGALVAYKPRKDGPRSFIYIPVALHEDASSVFHTGANHLCPTRGKVRGRIEHGFGGFANIWMTLH